MEKHVAYIELELNGLTFMAHIKLCVVRKHTHTHIRNYEMKKKHRQRNPCSTNGSLFYVAGVVPAGPLLTDTYSYCNRTLQGWPQGNKRQNAAEGIEKAVYYPDL